jgi:hypothetical protein
MASFENSLFTPGTLHAPSTQPAGRRPHHRRTYMFASRHTFPHTLTQQCLHKDGHNSAHTAPQVYRCTYRST